MDKIACLFSMFLLIGCSKSAPPQPEGPTAPSTNGSIPSQPERAQRPITVAVSHNTRELSEVQELGVTWLNFKSSKNGNVRIIKPENFFTFVNYIYAREGNPKAFQEKHGRRVRLIGTPLTASKEGVGKMFLILPCPSFAKDEFVKIEFTDLRELGRLDFAKPSLVAIDCDMDEQVKPFWWKVYSNPKLVASSVEDYKAAIDLP
ncbi:MAG: hypothetical protein K2X82_14735 [Gemmataceae bacterium]|nr:hypothetical protein [Gemmataceae bacterium]